MAMGLKFVTLLQAFVCIFSCAAHLFVKRAGQNHYILCRHSRSLVQHGPFASTAVLTPPRHGGNKFFRRWVQTDGLQDFLLPRLKRISASLQLTHARLCTCPDVLLWVQLWRIFWPPLQCSNPCLPHRCFRLRCMKELLPIQQDIVGPQSWEGFLQEWTQPLLYECRPSGGSQRTGHFEVQLLAIGGGEPKNFELPGFLPILPWKPPLGSLKGWQLLLALGHVSPRGAVFLKSRLQLLWVPRELLEVTSALAICLPLAWVLVKMPVAEGHSPFHQLGTWVALAIRLICGQD